MSRAFRFLCFHCLIFLLFAPVYSKTLKSGIDLENFDISIRPQDNFYTYVNGKWLEKTKIPPDKSNYGVFTALYDENQERLRNIIETVAETKNAVGSEKQKVADFYRSFLDTITIEKIGLKPLLKELQRIDAVQSSEEMLSLFAHFAMIGVQRPFLLYIDQDEKQSTRYICYVSQSGLGLPDRDYYFNEDAKFESIRSKYVAHIEAMLTLAGSDSPSASANRIMEIETDLAKHHWTRVQNRERDKTYNKFKLARLREWTPDFDWSLFLKKIGAVQEQEIVVRQPDFLKAFNDIYKTVTLDDWKRYCRWKLISNFAEYLPQAFVDEDFNFYRGTLSGIQQNQPRWERAVNAVNGVLGEAVGKIYVEKYFTPEAKARMQQLVANLKAAYQQRITALDWMGAETKKRALVKLSKFNPKIGYPDKWKDYSGLEIEDNELIRNIILANQFEFAREINKLGKPIDRDEWFMTPQTVNAYYNPSMNEIVFPAAILQPPFFNMEAEDAVNYGGIGAVIGHEMTHGFDDQGRKSDGDGNLTDWWTEADAAEFDKRGAILKEQYAKFSPLDSMFVNGELTLGENIADLGGLTIAFHAYKKSLAGKKSPVIDGFTGEQRFFLGWAQVWRRKYREEELARRLVIDPHSPSEYRVIGVVSNMPEFYQAFNVKEGDPMYRSQAMRAEIW
ncbi:peptidase M13 [candidate division KSB1 bacterium]|nr:peptidase M13 [candidate division KSB1 bacterium]